MEVGWGEVLVAGFYFRPATTPTNRNISSVLAFFAAN